MPRFVILRHECPPDLGKSSHWDLMFEEQGVLRTWSVFQLPCAAGPAVEAELLPAHRLAYLDLEGPLTGNRGRVDRVDAGQFEWLSDDARRVELRLAGAVFRGVWRIEATGDGRASVAWIE